MCIFNRRQDEELDALSASVQRIGGVGLTIHEELVGQVPSHPDIPCYTCNAMQCVSCFSIFQILYLINISLYVSYVAQEKLLGELSLDMETTSNRLDFVQV